MAHTFDPQAFALHRGHTQKAKLSHPSALTPGTLAALVRLSDALLLSTLGVVLAIVGAGTAELPHYAVATLIGAISATQVFSSCGLYRISALARDGQNVVRLTLGWAATLAVLVAAILLLRSGHALSQSWLMAWFAAGTAGLVLSRTWVGATVRQRLSDGRLSRRAVIVGANERAIALIAALRAETDTGIEICGVFDDRAETRHPEDVAGVPLCGRLDDLVTYARTRRVDDILLTLPATAETRLLTILEQLSVLPVDIRLDAHVSRLPFRPRAYSYIGRVPFIDLFERPIGDWGVILKSAFDRVVALIALILLAPVLAGVAIAIRLDSRGPILFRQKRYGFNNELVEVFKFRSMHVDMTDASAARLVTKDDPRVTRIGRFIRKTSLDELPQLLNVLQGTLSLVGPRPHAVKAKAANRLYDEVVDGYFGRHKVKPGITGWAQINGWRGETDTEEKITKRVEHDLYYIENWSIFFDIYILYRTPFALLNTKNAY